MAIGGWIGCGGGAGAPGDILLVVFLVAQVLCLVTRYHVPKRGSCGAGYAPVGMCSPVDVYVTQ